MSEIREVHSSVLTKEEIEDATGSILLDPESLDVAIIGTKKNELGQVVFVYSSALLIECFEKIFYVPSSERDRAEAMEDAYEMAVDWFDYNTVRSIPYLGEARPILVDEIFEEDEDEDDIAEVVSFLGKFWKVSSY